MLGSRSQTPAGRCLTRRPGRADLVRLRVAIASIVRGVTSRCSSCSTVSTPCFRAPVGPCWTAAVRDMGAMSAAQFEARYRADPDPWGYTSSPYEREKYRATLSACGGGPFEHGLELGGSIGVFSELLAPRCRR